MSPELHRPVDMPLDGPESHVQTTDADPSGSYPTVPDSLSVTSTAGYRGFESGGLGCYHGESEIWSMSLIKSMDSQWLGPGDGYLPVGEVIQDLMWKLTHWEEYTCLIESMNVWGQQVPIRVFPPIPLINLPARLRDGIHRIAIADYFGWDSMLVTTGIMEKSMWQNWDESLKGRKFHELKARRLGIGE